MPNPQCWDEGIDIPGGFGFPLHHLLAKLLPARGAFSSQGWREVVVPEVNQLQLPGISHMGHSHVLGMLLSEDEDKDRVKPHVEVILHP